MTLPEFTTEITSEFGPGYEAEEWGNGRLFAKKMLDGAPPQMVSVSYEKGQWEVFSSYMLWTKGPTLKEARAEHWAKMKAHMKALIMEVKCD